MRSELWEILVPCAFNDGRPIRTRHHREWDRQVRTITGGLTVMKPAIGQWVSPKGDLFKERMIPVRIMCSEKEIQEIGRRTIKHYDQLAVMYYRISDKCVVMEA